MTVPKTYDCVNVLAIVLSVSKRNFRKKVPKERDQLLTNGESEKSLNFFAFIPGMLKEYASEKRRLVILQAVNYIGESSERKTTELKLFTFTKANIDLS